MSKERMLTTIDNPYSPWTNWDEWYAYDQIKGHCSCEFLARMCSTSDSLSDSENEELMYQAMKRICEIDPKYKMVERDTPLDPIPLDTVGG